MGAGLRMTLEPLLAEGLVVDERDRDRAWRRGIHLLRRLHLVAVGRRSADEVPGGVSSVERAGRHRPASCGKTVGLVAERPCSDMQPPRRGAPMLGGEPPARPNR
jgi:hypothetical protein